MSAVVEVCGCGTTITHDTSPGMVLPGGWCVPSATLYELPAPPQMCSDCKTRMLMITELGIDPGPNGINLRTLRGGIRFGGGQ